MNQETNDQGWQQIQSNVDQLLRQFFEGNLPAIEYKTNVRGFLQSLPENGERKSEDEIR